MFFPFSLLFTLAFYSQHMTATRIANATQSAILADSAKQTGRNVFRNEQRKM